MRAHTSARHPGGGKRVAACSTPIRHTPCIAERGHAEPAVHAKYTLDSMRPHTHTHDVRHTRLPLTSNRTEPRSRSPSCAKRVYVTSPKRHTRHGSCARTARSSQRTQDRMWFDLSSQTATQSRHAEQTRGRRHPDARLERSKERRPAAAACPRAAPPRPWRRTCRGT